MHILFILPTHHLLGGGQNLTHALAKADQLLLIVARPSSNDDRITILEELARLAAYLNGHFAAVRLLQKAAVRSLRGPRDGATPE